MEGTEPILSKVSCRICDASSRAATTRCSEGCSKFCSRNCMREQSFGCVMAGLSVPLVLHTQKTNRLRHNARRM